MRGAALLLAALLALSPAASDAADSDGVYLPDRMRLGDGELVLSGCGIREVLWTELYMIGLYLPQPLRQPEAILQRAEPKAVRVQIMFDGNIPDELPSEWRTHLREELSRDVFRTFKNLYAGLEQGDVLLASFHPETGSAVKLNGRKVAQTPDAAVVDALLELWIGPDPVSKNLRRLLLNGDC